MRQTTGHSWRERAGLRTAAGFAGAIAILAAFDAPGIVASLARGSPPALREYAGASVPHYAPLTLSLGLSLAPWLAFAVLLFVLAARMAARIRQSREMDGAGSGDGLAIGERGGGAIEFVLMLPIVLSILLLILQVALLVQAKFVVNYAAFCAVRSAIVWIPVEASGGEAHNHIDRSNAGSEKMQKLWRSASLACVPISPHYSDDLADRTGISDASSEQKDAVDRIAQFFPSEGDDRVVASFKNRLAYAFDTSNTTVEIIAEPGGAHDQASGEYGDHDPVTVRVTHRYFLGIPLANRLMGTSFGVGPGSGFYYPISEQYTLLNEGEPLGS